MKILTLILALCWTALVAPAAAQTPTLAPASPQAGQQIATSGATGVTACMTCHGAQGEGMAASGFPRLAGLPEYYLNKQMASFANGSRNNPVMSPIAKAMNAAQVRDVGAWYASLAAPTPAPAPAAGSAAAIARGRVLAGVGDESKEIQACANCHGPGGAGEPPVYPYLAGQHASYLTAAIAEWKSGARNTDASGQMPKIAKALSDNDVAAVAAYYGSRPAPRPAAAMVNVPAGSAARPAIAARPDAPGPRGAGPTGQGVGTEQGAPLTGGSQGPGGGGGTQVNRPPPPPIKK
jgi:cytochrome c553